MKNTPKPIWKKHHFWILISLLFLVINFLMIKPLSIDEIEPIEHKFPIDTLEIDTIFPKIEPQDSNSIKNHFPKENSTSSSTAALLEGKIDFIKGKAKAIVPRNMITGKSSIASLVIGEKSLDSYLQKQVMEIARTSDSTQIISKEELTIGRWMEATLKDPNKAINPNFHIEENSERKQYVDLENDKSVNWDWFVTPINEGEHDLYLRLNVVLNKNGKNYKKSITLFNDKVKVIATKPDVEKLPHNESRKEEFTVKGIEVPKKVSSSNENNSIPKIFLLVVGALIIEIVLLVFIARLYRKLKKRKKYNLDFLSKEEELKIEHYIKNDNLEKAISLVLARIGKSNEKLKNELLLLMSNYKSNKKSYTLNLISHEEFGREKSKQALAIIELLNNAKNENYSNIKG